VVRLSNRLDISIRKPARLRDRQCSRLRERSVLWISIISIITIKYRSSWPRTPPRKRRAVRTRAWRRHMPRASLTPNVRARHCGCSDGVALPRRCGGRASRTGGILPSVGEKSADAGRLDCSYHGSRTVRQGRSMDRSSERASLKPNLRGS